MAKAKRKPTTLPVDDTVWLDPELDLWSLTDVYDNLEAARRDWDHRMSALPWARDADLRARVHAVFHGPLLLSVPGEVGRLFRRRFLAAGPVDRVACDTCGADIVPWLRRCGDCRKRLGADVEDAA